MATRFEIVLHGPKPVALRAAGEEALAEIDRIEGLLSLYRNTSEIAHVNARAAEEAVRVSPAVFRLLEQARALSEATEGAFDITIAPLVRCWGFMGGTGAMPDPAAVEEARARVGYRLIELDRASSTVRFGRPGVMLDLGAIGKGYAIEQAVDILREAGVSSAIVHGGTSTVYALGCPPGEAAWQVAIEHPPASDAAATPGSTGDSQGQGGLLAVVPLRDEALSVSAVWGRSFAAGARRYGHVIDPRTGQPVDHSVLSAVILPSATETDALSTALLTIGRTWLDALLGLRPGGRALVAATNGAVESRGITCR